ncbi:uncharacterized protein LY89DRAFT_729759 [Mollisia scopiformis]|uniref:Uncharacterized protein n=1 Tax=Mollisia scopiformis TaxID=149040 RepID=A0A194XLD9_MOLSC|nr:uncharacterized protein LY89DRAFT_729759 [Mollisia scopiformis]KUJ20946.1 hypothetical protein LY89DRAFT_729759 [Mollisia scopiformis]
MRASTASMILAFCAMVAVQGAPVSSDSAIVARDNNFEYDAAGNEIEKRGTHDFEYDADGNGKSPGIKFVKLRREEHTTSNMTQMEMEKIEERGTHDFEYAADGSEIEERDFLYDANGDEIDEDNNLVHKREPKKKAKKAKKAKRDSFEYDAEGNEILDDEEVEKRDSFEYDAAGNEIEDDEQTDSFEYDAAGNEIEDDQEVEKRDPKKKKAKKAKA